jgi:mono/diheme cytochrome c family protein
VSDTERGRKLFVAKGCVTCHEQIEVGPKLEGKRFDVGYISGFIANPPSTPTRGGSSPMPNLGLRQREIASLVAFLNSDRQVTTR